MPFPPDPDPHVKELKRYHLGYYVWMNHAKAALPSFNIEIYGWKVTGD